MTKKARAKQIIVEIIRAEGGEFHGETRLYKAFYFAHLYYYLRASGLLSDWPIVRMPNGPGIDLGAKLLEELESAGQIERHTVQNGPYREKVFTLLGNPPFHLHQDERDAITEAVTLIHGTTATELSDMLHENCQAWIESRDGQEINPYIDITPQCELDQTRRRLQSIERQVAEVFRG